MTTLYLARHGETEWNAAGRLQGHTDVPLNAVGRAQAAALAARLGKEPVAVVVASDLARARHTGEIVREALGLAREVIVDAELRERRFGVFEGLTRDEILERHGEAWTAWTERRVPPPGGEPTLDIVARFHRAMRRAADAASAHGGPALVVAHGGVMRVWLSSITARAIEPIGNGALYEVTFGDSVGAAPWPGGWPDASTARG